MSGPSSSVRVSLLLVMILVAGITTVAMTAALPKPSPTTTASTTFSETIASSSTFNSTAAVTFRQEGDCSPTVYTVPWAVQVFGTAYNGTYLNETEVEPAAAPIPTDGGGFTASVFPANDSVIDFAAVPDGSFQYNVHPAQAFYNPSGFFMVNGTTVTVYIEGPAISCTTSTGTATQSGT